MSQETEGEQCPQSSGHHSPTPGHTVPASPAPGQGPQSGISLSSSHKLSLPFPHLPGKGTNWDSKAAQGQGARGPRHCSSWSHAPPSRTGLP